MSQAEKAEQFRALHRGPSILVLPNAWDAASARLIEEAGFPAVATTSAGVANSLGYPDGQHIPSEEMLAAVKRIAAAVQVPATADVEAGYGESAEAVGETARRVWAAGAVGINLEDSWMVEGRRTLAGVGLQQERIRAAREAGLFVNARTDVFAFAFSEVTDSFSEGVRRLNAYLSAGAECAFPILAREPKIIGELARAIEGPINILALPGMPEIDELEKLGVRRVTFGSGLMRAALGTLRAIVRELKSRGTYEAFPKETIPSPEMNGLFRR
jgi:2-methylisocitrate lyase-like PEP mutase family enzyme